MGLRPNRQLVARRTRQPANCPLTRRNGRRVASGQAMKLALTATKG
ncbi:hypothetical protein I552_4927 [Mycobacterium xenopi 3993]|nr:hypothetical protein I552_4927 [Mycobacterium xenopi 3993]